MRHRVLASGLAAVALGACGGGGGGGGGSAGLVDTLPPTVSISSPNSGATVNGSIVVTAVASDDTGVEGVSLQVDGQTLGDEIDAAPYEFTWDTSQESDGMHLLTAVAWDAAGNSATSTTVPVQVNSSAPPDTSPPAVAIALPADGSVVSGDQLVIVTATDDVGISGVEVLLDGALLSPRLSAAPYVYTWDTTDVPDGVYTLTAVAGDPSHNVAFSTAVGVTVANVTPVPEVSFATLLGDSEKDSVRDAFVDRDGFIYIAGGTESPAFPATPGAYDTSYNGVHDVFVAKLDADGNLLFSTFLGGPNYDRAYAIEVDAQGFIYVCGRSGDGFPTTPGSVQPVFVGTAVPQASYGEQDGFITKLSPDGSQIVWSTFFGGDDHSVLRDIDLDADGEIYVVATSALVPHPHVTPGSFDPTLDGPSDGFVAKVSNDGSQVLYGAYLGGSNADGGTPSVRVDADGYAYVLDHTYSADAPVTPGAYQQNLGGDWDMLLARVSPAGDALVFCTYFGGTLGEFSETHGLSVDRAGNAVITATTRSADLPFVPAAIPPPFQATYQGTGGPATGGVTNYPGDCFAARISADGTTLLGFTYVGGSVGEGVEGSAVDRDGYVYLGGATFSADFPVTADAFQTTKSGLADAFMVKLAPDFSSVVFATFWGGNQDDFGRTLAVGRDREVVLAGSTDSPTFPTTPGAYDTSFVGNPFDAFLVRAAFQP